MSCGLFVVFLQLIIYLLVGCQVLADIELAQELESESEKKKEAQVVIVCCMHVLALTVINQKVKKLIILLTSTMVS